MRLYELITKVSFSDVMKELLITNKQYKEKQTQFSDYFQTLSEIIISGRLESILVINKFDFDRCYLLDRRDEKAVNSGLTYIAIEDYLNAELGDWEEKHLSPAHIMSALLVTLTESGTCFSEDDRMKFANKLYWDSFGLTVKVRISKSA